MYMSNLWVTFSTDSSGSFTELSGNIIYNVNNLYNFNGNVIDTTSNFIIYELSNNPIQTDISLQASNWKQLSLNNNLTPFQGYWLGGINTILPGINTILPEITELLLTSFYYGPLSGSVYESDLTNHTDATNILRISLSEKIQSPETLKNKYMNFSNYGGYGGIYIEIFEYISEKQNGFNNYSYFFKITDHLTTEVQQPLGETLIPVITSEYIFLAYDYNTNNLGVRWIISDLMNSNHGSGGNIPRYKEFVTGITYTGDLEIDANTQADIHTSYTNFVYLDTAVTINETSQNVYNITLVWNGLTRTIENLNI